MSCYLMRSRDGSPDARPGCDEAGLPPKRAASQPSFDAPLTPGAAGRCFFQSARRMICKGRSAPGGSSPVSEDEDLLPLRACAKKGALARTSALTLCLQLLLLVLGAGVLLELTTSFGFSLIKGRFEEHNGGDHSLLTADHTLVPDAIVIVAMGDAFVDPKNNYMSVLEACLCSLRHSAAYAGAIVLVTDQTKNLADSATLAPFRVQLLPVEPVSTLTRVWFIKCKLLEILPPEFRSIMYLDSDIMATAPLEELFASVPRFTEGYVGVFSDVTTRFGRADAIDLPHAGVIFLQRGASESCLQSWCDRMEGNPAPSDRQPWGVGEVEDDQVALSMAVALGGKCHVWWAPDHYLQFMADFKTMLVRPPAVLAHFTRTARRRLVGRWAPFWRALIFSRHRIGAECAAPAHAAYLPAGAGQRASAAAPQLAPASARAAGDAAQASAAPAPAMHPARAALARVHGWLWRATSSVQQS